MKITALWVYPVKSCRGIPVSRARVLARGLEGDRRFMIATPEGEKVTQRERPELARVRTAFVDGGVRLEAPGHAPLHLLDADAEGAPTCTVQLWRTPLEVHRMRDASAWFSSVLGAPVWCVRQQDDVPRPINPEYAGPGDHVNLADGYPLTLASEESLEELNRRLRDAGAPPATMENFRPNVVIEGAPYPFAEDDWPTIRLGSWRMRMPKPSDRCILVNVEPTSGVVRKDPLRTLATFRARDQRVLFAVNLIPDDPPSGDRELLQVGDEVEALSAAGGAAG